ncbi:hypothetical protein SAMN05444392_11042 [Seinonella peptonophila]|uniref:Uncharacterized protein n=1 Tax=Seinonella peptonophila TaxID=112248 RepID=A0A1M4ZPW9_9BACL|nr:hypothetical protein [Seinonella peptonophila]SHF19975.1 hypothetical protein SAMN05444392_11042 [Seinonella peptonophila]
MNQKTHQNLTRRNHPPNFLPIQDPKRFKLPYFYGVAVIVLVSVLGTFIWFTPDTKEKTVGLKSTKLIQSQSSLVKKPSISTYKKRVAINEAFASAKLISTKTVTKKYKQKKKPNLAKTSTKIKTTQLPKHQQKTKTVALSQPSKKGNSKPLPSTKPSSNKYQSSFYVNMNNHSSYISYDYNGTNYKVSSNNGRTYTIETNSTNSNNFTVVNPGSSNNSYTSEPGFIEGSY